jgi:hypothetical protein
MRRVVQGLPYLSLVLASCAIVAGLGAGLLEGTFGADFVCFDSCPDRDFYFSYLGPGTAQLLLPCIVLGVLATAVFVTYCLATRQVRRAVLAFLVLLVGGLAGIAALAALAALLQHAQATLPSASGSDCCALLPDQLQAWQRLWGWALALVAGAWSGVLAYLQWQWRR